MFMRVQSVYLIVVLINTDKLQHFKLNIFYLDTLLNKMLHNSICQFVNNLYCVIKYFVDIQILYSYIKNKGKFNSSSTSNENKHKQPSVGILM